MAANWYYMLKGKRSGPITARALHDLVNSGVLSEDSLVWKEGLENWLPVARLRGGCRREPRRPSAATEAASDSQPQSPPATRPPEADSVPVFTSSVQQRSSDREFMQV